jgi:ABC-2 type transport system permease protein
MIQFLSFIRKEFKHVFRDQRTLMMLFGMPIIQILLFGFALTNEIKNARIVVVDNAHDKASQELMHKLEGSRFFLVERSMISHNQIEAAFKKGKIKLVLVFPPNFYADLLHTNKAGVQVIADASDPNTANTLIAYINSIIGDYQSSLSPNFKTPFNIHPEVRMLYNPDLKGAPNFLPGVMAMVLLLVCVMMTSISIVREKELGTMEILLVSPMHPIMVIIAKALPYFVLSLVNLIVILVLSVTTLNLPIKGSVFLLFGESALLILTALSLGLLVSTITNSQSAAMFTSLLGFMLPTMLLSGYMFPIENMPRILQVISNAIPSRWYYIIVKSVMLKGLGFKSIWKETLILAGMMVFFMTLALRNFKIRLQ